MKIVRKLALATIAGLLGVGALGATTGSASAMDSSWGCGGHCMVAPGR